MHITAHLDVDVVALETDDQVTVMLQFDAPQPPVTGRTRVEHTAIVVLDRSGSMTGTRLDNAKQALLRLVDRLDDGDRFGLVVFDDQAQVLVPADRVGALGRTAIKRAIASVQPGGSTDLSSGYLRGLQEARRVAGPAGATVLLLSDGMANAGITDPDQLASLAGRATADRVTTSTIGIGTGYDETILAAVAVGGQGNHAFAEHAEGTTVAVAGEIDGLLSKTVQAASVLIRPLDGVASLTVMNHLPSVGVSDGVLVELGDFYAGEERRLLLEFAVPARAALGLATIADIEVRFVELPSLVEHVVSVPVSVNVVPADVAAGRLPSAAVSEEKLLLQVQDAKKRSEEALRYGDVDSARAELRSAADVIASAPVSAETAAEAAWVTETLGSLDDRDEGYNLKRMRASSSRAARGYKTRHQGGEIV